MSRDLGRRAVDGAFWAYAQNWLARGLTLVVFLALGRLLGPSDFGAFAVANVLLCLAEVVVEQGFAHAIVQRSELAPAHLNAAFWATAAAGMAFAVVAVVATGPVSSLFGHVEIGAIVAYLSPAFVFMALSSVPAALLRRELRYRALARRAVVSNMLSGVVAVVMALAGAGVWAFVGQQLVYHFAGFVFLWRHEAWRPVPAFSFSHLRELGGFSFQITLAKLLEFVETRVVDLIVGSALGLTALGNYSLASRASQALTQIVAAPLWEAALSTFARLQFDASAAKGAYLKMAEFSGLVAVPAFLISAAAAPQLIPAVFGAQWTGSVVAFQVLGIVGAVRAFSMLDACLIQATGMAGASLLVSGLRAATTLSSLAIGLQFGIAGVALALLAGQLLAAPLLRGISRRKHRIPVAAVATSLLKPMLAVLVGCGSAAAVGATVDARQGHVVAALATVAAGALSFLCTLILAMPQTLAGHLAYLPSVIARPLSTALRRFLHVR